MTDQTHAPRPNNGKRFLHLVQGAAEEAAAEAKKATKASDVLDTAAMVKDGHSIIDRLMHILVSGTEAEAKAAGVLNEYKWTKEASALLVDTANAISAGFSESYAEMLTDDPAKPENGAAPFSLAHKQTGTGPFYGQHDNNGLALMGKEHPGPILLALVAAAAGRVAALNIAGNVALNADDHSPEAMNKLGEGAFPADEHEPSNNVHVKLIERAFVRAFRFWGRIAIEATGRGITLANALAHTQSKREPTDQETQAAIGITIGAYSDREDVKLTGLLPVITHTAMSIITDRMIASGAYTKAPGE